MPVTVRFCLACRAALQHRKTEVSVWFALAGALLVLAAVALAQWWSRAERPGGRRQPVV
ncbi:hypothetical protein [Dactylosporangium sp. NPDC048998]|uniref:hypothetical protein n=1 Tax=Dactylosporangium sp. NPDC048998 TaxID=3363976 RepID=UPI00371048AA